MIEINYGKSILQKLASDLDERIYEASINL